MNPPLLSATAVSKSFAGVAALRDVSFELRAGEVHALVGENGAGKSTLIKIFTGAVVPDEGEIRLNGELITDSTPHKARSLGISPIYQQPALFPDLTVCENLTLANESGSAWRVLDWRTRRQRAEELLAQAGARINPDAVAGTLSMPEQQLVEIGRALGGNACVLILDEPTASLTEEETQRLFQTIRDLRARGVGLVYISHRLEELFEVADRVTVLRDGRIIGTHPMNGIDRAGMIRMMAGRELSAVFPKRTVPLGDVVLETRGLNGVSLTLRRGEILGMAGMAGAGRTEFAEAVFGLRPVDRGTIHIDGREVRIGDPARAIALGLAYVPEDRRRNGAVMDMAVAPNITLSILQSGWLHRTGERRIAGEYREKLRIKTASLDTPVRNLSGGNQQKVVLGRWLATHPRVLILDEPTQGIDVGAKAEIHELMVELASQGLAILMISSELPEILGMSDRIAVMRGGAIAGMLDRQEATQERILALALGGAAA